MIILSIVNDSITFTDYQKTLFYLKIALVCKTVLYLLSQLETHSYERYICTQLLYKI